jgi:hypothetical protein
MIDDPVDHRRDRTARERLAGRRGPTAMRTEGAGPIVRSLTTEAPRVRGF